MCPLTLNLVLESFFLFLLRVPLDIVLKPQDIQSQINVFIVHCPFSDRERSEKETESKRKRENSGIISPPLMALSCFPLHSATPLHASLSSNANLLKAEENSCFWGDFRTHPIISFLCGVLLWTAGFLKNQLGPSWWNIMVLMAQIIYAATGSTLQKVMSIF